MISARAADQTTSKKARRCVKIALMKILFSNSHFSRKKEAAQKILKTAEQICLEELNKDPYVE